MRRSIDVDGERWDIYPSGRVTFYSRDEMGLIFQKGSGPDVVRRVTRYAPLGARRPDKALAELTDAQLHEFFTQSQPAATSPETNYTRRVG
jgi:hypothetical protein